MCSNALRYLQLTPPPSPYLELSMGMCPDTAGVSWSLCKVLPFSCVCGLAPQSAACGLDILSTCHREEASSDVQVPVCPHAHKRRERCLTPCTGRHLSRRSTHVTCTKPPTSSGGLSGTCRLQMGEFIRFAWVPLRECNAIFAIVTLRRFTNCSLALPCLLSFATFFQYRHHVFLRRPRCNPCFSSSIVRHLCLCARFLAVGSIGKKELLW